jgi:hypothetical protein
MSRHALIAFGVVVFIGAGGSYLLASIDRRAAETVVVPKVQAPQQSEEVAVTDLPPPGPDSIFQEPKPEPKFEVPPPAVPDACDLLLTLPPKQRC